MTASPWDCTATVPQDVVPLALVMFLTKLLSLSNQLLGYQLLCVQRTGVIVIQTHLY